MSGNKKKHCVHLVINDWRYVLNEQNQKVLKKVLTEAYPPDQIVEEWVDEKKVNELRLEDVFN